MSGAGRPSALARCGWGRRFRNCWWQLRTWLPSDGALSDWPLPTHVQAAAAVQQLGSIGTPLPAWLRWTRVRQQEAVCACGGNFACNKMSRHESRLDEAAGKNSRCSRLGDHGISIADVARTPALSPDLVLALTTGKPRDLDGRRSQRRSSCPQHTAVGAVSQVQQSCISVVGRHDSSCVQRTWVPGNFLHVCCIATGTLSTAH